MKNIPIKDLREGDEFVSVKTGNCAATGGVIEKVGRVNLFFGGDYMGNPVSGIKLPLENLIGGTLRRDGVVYRIVGHEPEWSKYKLIGEASSVADAMDRFYKNDRLNRPGGTRERLIADRQADLDANGHACVASYHDSVTGQGIFLRMDAARLDVYSTQFP